MKTDTRPHITRIPAAVAAVAMAALVLLLAAGCSTAYYSTMEKLGKEKRHLLKDNVEDVQDSQTKAKEEFKDALTRIKELYNFDGGNLEDFYSRLKSSYEDCEDRAAQIEKRIAGVETVAKDLFEEWEDEINRINDTTLKSASRRSLADAKAKYRKLDAAMKQSTRNMYPVLAKLSDYVLYLKHNLNARALGALEGEILSIEQEVGALIKDMTVSIAEAENFIQAF